MLLSHSCAALAPPHPSPHPQEIRYPTFRLTARFFAPLGPFANQAGLDPDSMEMDFTMSFVNKAYTSFEVGWKMFFVTGASGRSGG